MATLFSYEPKRISQQHTFADSAHLRDRFLEEGHAAVCVDSLRTDRNIDISYLQGKY